MSSLRIPRATEPEDFWRRCCRESTDKEGVSPERIEFLHYVENTCDCEADRIQSQQVREIHRQQAARAICPGGLLLCCILKRIL